MASSHSSVEPAIAQVKRLVIAQLKNVCKGAGLPSSGIKAALQNRIISQLQRYASQGNYDALNQLKSLVQDPTASASLHSTPPAPARGYSNIGLGSYYPYQNTLEGPRYPDGATSSKNSSGVGIPHFKHSPFYTIREPLTRVIECQVRETNRDTVRTSINLPQNIADIINRDESNRVLLYCAMDSGLSPFSRVDISFPHQVEVKVNQDEVKANFRGLKNRPGTTRPVDITPFLRKRSGYNNEVAVTYALTKTRFLLIVNLAKQHTVAELITRLKNGKIITEKQVLREMATRAEDSDVVATSTILSLKCPLSTLRMVDPCRSSVCNHNQCFDATSFLQLQEQAPTWTCPICNKHVEFENLHIDQYLKSILQSTVHSCDQVSVEPGGKWFAKHEDSASSMNRRLDNDLDDDLVEVTSASLPAIKSESRQDSVALFTPSIPSREPSFSSISRQPASKKRPMAPVVDLTLSGDEEEEATTAPKRRNVGGHDSASTSSASNVIPFHPSSVQRDVYRPDHYSINGQSSSLQYKSPMR